MGKKQLNLFEPGQRAAARPRPTDAELKDFIARIHPDFKSVWDVLPEGQQLALAAYFLPWGSKKEQIGPTRPRVLNWYCPFAAQAVFPSGHRYCLNVYSGCAHDCEYCYAMSYAPPKASCKRGFERMLEQDLADLETFDVPPAPIHLSNSTDPFQPLEQVHGHTRLALEQILEHRHRFTTVTMLTKNPPLPVKLGYLDLFQSLGRIPATQHVQVTPPFQVQVRVGRFGGGCLDANRRRIDWGVVSPMPKNGTPLRESTIRRRGFRGGTTLMTTFYATSHGRPAGFDAPIERTQEGSKKGTLRRVVERVVKKSS